MRNVALLSRWHVHADEYAKEVIENKALTISHVWDEDKDRGQAWANELDVLFEGDLEKVLKNPLIDAVIVNTPTSLHKEVIKAAAKSRKHIFSEKVLAFTVEECEEIYHIIEKNEIKFMLSLPRLTDSYYLFVQKAVDEGKIGELTTIRCRLAHNGAVSIDGSKTGWLPQQFYNKTETGGEALIDLGAHPIYLTNRLAGQVRAVQARLQETNHLGVDDNAIVLIEYESGALGVIETSFISGPSPFQLELYGTKGTILIEGNRVRYHFGSGWKEAHANDIESIDSPMQQWVNDILHGDKPTIKKEDVVSLTKINELALQSHKQNKRIELN